MSINLANADTRAWLARGRKFVIGAAVAVIEIANVWVNGPDWLYAAAAVAGSILLYFVPNAPKYVDPRATAQAQATGQAIH